MPKDKRAAFAGRLVMLGMGSVGQAILPLILRHLEIQPGQIEVIKPSDRGMSIAARHGIRHTEARLSVDNFRALLRPRLGPGDVLLNLSVNVGSKDLIAFCQQQGALYLDASTEPWAGTYDNGELPLAARTNYALRRDVLSLRTGAVDQPTALVTLGANPGMVSFLVKRALLDLAGPDQAVPSSRSQWAQLARALGVRVIHIAERDSQVANRHKRQDEFVNTWSVDGFIAEALQPAELGWGTHERHLPDDAARHATGCRSAIYLKRPGAATRVRSWAPLAGAFEGFLVSHAEAISIAHYLTGGDPDEPEYRPTVHYAYQPCDDAVLSLHELSGRRWRPQSASRVLRDDITSGRDELGVLLMGPDRGAYWLGSQLSIEEARKLCPYNSATSLQVAAPLLAGIIWALRHPRMGVLEPDELPFAEMLALVQPYWGEIIGVHTKWTPLEGRSALFEEPVDENDPWQFRNFRVY
jgi:homospermidine synthase